MRILKLVTWWAPASALIAARLAAGTPSDTVLAIDPEADATISVTPIAERWDGGGFMPVRVRVENRADRKRTWTLKFFTTKGYSGHEVLHEVPVTAEAESVNETVVFVAGGSADARMGAAVRVEAEGPGAARGYGNFVQTSSEPLIITATTPAQETALFAATNGVAGAKTEIAALDSGRWPADWRTWAPFHRVVLTEPDYAALDGARRAALRDWVAMGGTLDLYPLREREEMKVETVGHGAIRRMQATLAKEAVTHPTVQVHVGSHAETVVSAERRAELSPATGALGLSFFLLGFGVLVGPINLFVLAPAHRRQGLFFTVPLISLGASALMGGYIVVKDGFGGKGSQRGLVLLLPESNQAVVRQQQVTRTGVLLGGDFELPEDAALAQIVVEDGVYRRGVVDTQVFRRSGGDAGGDWFSSRRVQEQTLARLVPTRARVELVTGSGEPTPVVQSSVGVVLRDFVYLDRRGRRWMADEVPPGQRVTLRRMPDGPASQVDYGCFSARGGAAEGLAPIPTLESIRWDEPEFIYSGPLTGARTP